MKKTLLALALLFPISSFAGDAAPAGDPRIAKIADALQNKGATGAIEAWKIRDLGLPYLGNAAVGIRISSFKEDIGNGKSRTYTVSTFNLDKRYTLLARGTDSGAVMVIAVDDNATILAGRWWRSELNSNLHPDTKQFLFDNDVPMWAERLGVK